MSSRRGFLGMLGFGAVAGPSVVTDVLSSSSLAGAGLASEVSNTMFTGEATEASSDYIPDIWDLRSSVKNLADLKPDDPRDFTVTFLDADLEVNKSMSLVTKRRIMAERQVKRNYENSKRNYKNRINNILQKQRKKFMPDVIYKALFDEETKEYDTPEIRRILNSEENK